MDFTDIGIPIILKNNLYYIEKTGKIINDSQLKLIHSLGIPPSYTKLWISECVSNNIQAIALDASGKKQYYYSKKWLDKSKNDKFMRMYQFMKCLPKARKKWLQHTNLEKGTKIWTMAHMLIIVDITCIRIGNKKYFDKNESYGLTTLKKEHIKLSKKGFISFKFKGKHEILQNIKFKSDKITQFLKYQRTCPGEWIMNYKNSSSEYFQVSAQDLNTYMQETTKSEEFSCKDFRTYGANVMFIECLNKLHKTDTPFQKKINIALEETAEKLGNNKATSKKAYVMERIIDAFKENPSDFINSPETIINKIFTISK